MKIVDETKRKTSGNTSEETSRRPKIPVPIHSYYVLQYKAAEQSYQTTSILALLKSNATNAAKVNAEAKKIHFHSILSKHHQNV